MNAASICGKANILVESLIRQGIYLVMANTRVFRIERFFQALGDRTRLRLLNLMGGQELCVCYFVEILGESQPKISRHLAYLRSAGIVSARREGKWMHYRVVMPTHVGASQILQKTLDWLKVDKDMGADRAMLSKACCSPSDYALLDGAPLPRLVPQATS